MTTLTNILTTAGYEAGYAYEGSSSGLGML